MHFTTTTGLTVRKCGFQREFPGAFVKRAEGIVLAVYFIFSLTLMVGSYVHILYRLKQQSKRLSQNLTSDGGQQETGLSVVSSISVRRTEEEVENTTYSYTESRDEERCVTRSVGGARELMSEDPSVSTIHPLQARSGTSVRVHQSRKLLASKTTLVLFVLTITTVVCLVPYLIWTAFPETVYGPQREFPGDFVKLAEGIVLAVYCVVGLALIVGSYGHILYRVKQQSKRLSQNLTSDGGQEETSLSVKSSPISGRRLEEEVQNTTEDCVESRDEERCVDQTEGGARELMLEDPSVSGSYPLPARRRMTVGVHQSRNLLASKTTLVMFVLTITTVVCLTPYIIWT
ncbi:hypothetical protein C0Q70_12919 [Pomacea canaliculata]|uniref:G-protein coupled receptors family 1 profile domain-containing protein n=1 Tax=Pomacea canaliculata TaxID=400727 RepID=A0A2T7P2U2_POMCA|nr:hypothetical protein C0Q70_12919 [Pomacea canaliculata]